MEAIRQDTRQAVARLEGQVARLRSGLWLLFLLGLAGAGYLAWQHLHPKAAPGILRVKGLVVEDEDGHARVVLAAPGLTVSDAQGQARMSLTLKDDGNGHLVLNDALGAPALAAEPGALTLMDAKQDAAVLSTVAGPTLQLRKGDKIVVKQPWDAQDLK